MGQKLNNRWNWKGKGRRFRREPPTLLIKLGNGIFFGGFGLLLMIAVYEAAIFPWQGVLGGHSQGALTEPADPAAPEETDPEPVGILKIPRLGVSVTIAEGTEEAQLKSGAGHLPGTAGPGEKGNCVIFGYRTYLFSHPFRHLELLRPGDQIVLSDETGRYLYEIYETRRVTPDQREVLEPAEGAERIVTLVTGTALLPINQRLVIRGRQLAAESGVAEAPH